MSMSQTEWARRVAAIGEMAGWGERKIAQFSEPHQITFLLFDRMSYDLYAPGPERVIAAIRHLCADWLAAEGVVAVRVCRWKRVGVDAFRGECAFTATISGEPVDQDMHYCPGCGGKIEVTP